ncbi:MAG TPA: biotin/lipoyl-binding protein, partial [Roseiflexaceae bacterium]|nr:biotin/lipoyl-binding protein [Roseiflexaceae bacterium]
MAEQTSFGRIRGAFQHAWVRITAGVAAILTLALGIGYAVLGNAQTSAERSYTLITPAYGPLTALVTAAGQIEPEQTVNLSFTTTSVVDAVLVRPGDQVAAGQVLARADTRELALRLAQAQAALRQAEA